MCGSQYQICSSVYLVLCTIQFYYFKYVLKHVIWTGKISRSFYYSEILVLLWTFLFFLSYVEFVVFSQINFDCMSSRSMLHVTTWIYLYFSFYLNNSSNILYRCFLLVINPSNLFLSLKVVVSMEVRITKLKIKKNDDKCWHGCKNGNM